jgi:uncharacterized protein YjbI with pentapeptide repeats
MRADLNAVCLENADLSNTNLQEANLSEADFKNTILYGADLRGANLTDIKNITIDQLSKVKSLFSVRLNADLAKQMREACPHLFIQPRGF